MDVLIVDDSAELLDLVERALSREGHEVRVAATIAQARQRIAERPPELMVLDLALPDGTGIELCRALRGEDARFPILLLTAHGEVPQRVAGLDAGADDFLAKPFAIAELRARVRALGRRGPSVRPTTTVVLGEAQLDLAARRAVREERELPLTAREWEVLELLINRQGRVVSRGTILELIWGEITDKASDSLDVIMARIRRKLGPEAIRTVRGEGYAADVA
jgi:DNA-binding response OmpR family regulator